MAVRRHWVARTGIGAAAAALLLAGLAASALGGESPARPRPLPAPAADRTAAGSAGAASTGGSGGTSGRPEGASQPAAGAPAGRPGNALLGALAAARTGSKGGSLAPMGAFTDSGEDGVQNLSALQSWLGGTTVRVGHTYLPGDSWDSIEGAGDLLEPWARWQRAEPGRMFVLNVPMQERNEDSLPDGEVRDLIQAGARGDDDAHFTRLAQRLVRLGVPDTVIVLGWEMNGATYSHRCGPDPEGWKAYWNRIVDAMRAVPGQHFRFDFAPNRGRDAIAWTACYPGDSTVDIIGMDSYDQPGGESFSDQVTEPYGLQAQVDFAAAHKKAVSYPEWGLFRNGDNPDYMAQMLSWIGSHHPLYQTITDYCPHGVWRCAKNPKASAVYRALMYGKKTEPPAAPTGQAASPAPAVPAQGGGRGRRTVETCSPVEMSPQTGQRHAGGGVCVRLRPKAAQAS
ncbi:glycoside hydrolase family 26 protein [Streptomyces sp. NPDC020917]|uniref:glycoside hydrolase family 26 protein n=1 Tax=Streptomyces sp. NPDC020917 TaxID=3365102 RepID=UPI0037A8006D